MPIAATLYLPNKLTLWRVVASFVLLLNNLPRADSPLRV